MQEFRWPLKQFLICVFKSKYQELDREIEIPSTESVKISRFFQNETDESNQVEEISNFILSKWRLILLLTLRLLTLH